VLTQLQTLRPVCAGQEKQSVWISQQTPACVCKEKNSTTIRQGADFTASPKACLLCARQSQYVPVCVCKAGQTNMTGRLQAQGLCVQGRLQSAFVYGRQIRQGGVSSSPKAYVQNKLNIGVLVCMEGR